MGAAWRRLRRGRLAGLRRLLVPYRVFEVVVSNAGRDQASRLAIDAVAGTLDPYQLEEPTNKVGARAEDVRLVPVLDDAALGQRLAERVRRQVFQRGFFRLRDLQIRIEPLGQPVWLPYWVGIFRRASGAVSVEVVGGVRREREGGKLRELALAWLAEEAHPDH